MSGRVEGHHHLCTCLFQTVQPIELEYSETERVVQDGMPCEESLSREAWTIYDHLAFEGRSHVHLTCAAFSKGLSFDMHPLDAARSTIVQTPRPSERHTSRSSCSAYSPARPLGHYLCQRSQSYPASKPSERRMKLPEGVWKMIFVDARGCLPVSMCRCLLSSSEDILALKFELLEPISLRVSSQKCGHGVSCNLLLVPILLITVGVKVYSCVCCHS